MDVKEWNRVLEVLLIGFAAGGLIMILVTFLSYALVPA